MNNGIIFLEKLIEDTKSGVITWTWLNNKDFQYRNVFKGSKNINGGKRIDFYLNFDSADRTNGRINVFLINETLKTKDLIYKLDPGFFSFKQKNLLDTLIDIIVDPIPNIKPRMNFWGVPIRKNVISPKKSEGEEEDYSETKPLKRIWSEDDLDDSGI